MGKIVRITEWNRSDKQEDNWVYFDVIVSLFFDDILRRWAKRTEKEETIRMNKEEHQWHLALTGIFQCWMSVDHGLFVSHQFIGFRWKNLMSGRRWWWMTRVTLEDRHSVEEGSAVRCSYWVLIVVVAFRNSTMPTTRRTKVALLQRSAGKRKRHILVVETFDCLLTDG